jgi:hypothetical protein
MVPGLIGLLLALAVGIFATSTGLDRDRAFYPVVTIVIGALYVLFAAIGGSTPALIADSLVGAVFVMAAVAGFRWTLWIAVVALAAHGLLDFTHHVFISNPGVPSWWPEFCGAYDLAAAGYLAWLLASGRVRAEPS